MIINSGNGVQLREIELYRGASKIDRLSISISMSSTSGSGIASNCNDGSFDSSDHYRCCITNVGTNQWVMAATSENFTKAIIFNRGGGDAVAINSASLVFMDSIGITKSAVSFISKGTSLAEYTFCSSGYNGTLCDTCSAGYTPNGLGECSEIRIFNVSTFNIYEEFLFIDDL
jgi:hypothetical protein